MSAPGYLIANLQVKDASTFGDYVAITPDMIARYGARYLVRNGVTKVIEGSPQLYHFVIIEFPSMEQLNDFVSNVDFEILLNLRNSCITTDVFTAEGYLPDALPSS